MIVPIPARNDYLENSTSMSHALILASFFLAGVLARPALGRLAFNLLQRTPWRTVEGMSSWHTPHGNF